MARDNKLRSSYPSYDHHSQHLYEQPIFQYFMILLIIATLIISAFALVNTYQLKKFIIPKPIDIKSFISKLTSHTEMKSYAGQTPSNIVQITNNNIGSLQSQIKGLDLSFVGSFLVQFQDKIIVVYDYANDTIKGVINLQPLLPDDFIAKLNKHNEMKNLQGQKPLAVNQLDESSLSALKSQSPDAYKNAKAGDYILRYQASLVIYDYSKDRIVNSFSIS